MDPHATGLCGDVLLNNICIIGYGLPSQLLGKVDQTRQTRLTEIIHNTKTETTKPNETNPGSGMPFTPSARKRIGSIL